MPKVNQGRLDGIWGMRRFTATELHAIADEYEAKIDDPDNEDDPKWLKRRADRLRSLALRKEKSIDHKKRNCTSAKGTHQPVNSNLYLIS